MKFSIIVVTYNSKWEKIKSTLDSIMKQTFQDFEIVISDDGSKHNYCFEIENYMEAHGFSNYKFITHEKNIGTVRNLLSAVEASSGKYIRDFGPGDLFYSEDSLKILYEFMENEKCQCCFGLVRGYYMDEMNKPISVEFHHPFDLKAYKTNNKKKLQKNLVLYRDYPPGSCTSYTRDFYLHYLTLLDGKVRYTEDILQIVAGLDGVFMRVVPEYIIWYETDSGVSNTRGEFSERMLRDVESFYCFLYAQYGDNKYVKKQRKVFRLYKIKNLYVRTLIRFFVNPGAMIYLLSHCIQTKSSVYRPMHVEKGFLDEVDYFEKCSSQ